MEILTQSELAYRKAEIIEKIRNGSLFIYPTDTIYGIGCNALKARSVQAIRKLKNRPDSPLSIWVPSKEWIRQHCRISPQAEKWLEKLPGPYTLIHPLKEEHPLPNAVIGTASTIGVRLPDHWFHQVVKECNFPIITTSANKCDEPFMTKLENLDEDIQNGVEFMIYEGEKESRPSTLINIEKEEIKER
ncbi:threonylcarbamoyl-AMP synthase [Candidatus Woesearchaeota archaeon]|nr:threonylcarbamoyl-AMP synthase [Candidatus Woesearchaeota archaeon]